MFKELSSTKIASALGFAVGCAFVTYVVRTMGYFSIVAPEYLGFFLETDLILGAIKATPFVIGLGSLVYLIAWITAIAVHHSDKVDIIFIPIDNLLAKRPSWTTPFLLFIFFMLVLASSFLFEGDNFIFRVLILYINLVLSLFWVADQHIENKVIHPLSIIACFFSAHTVLYETGKLEAIMDLNHSKARYSLSASDKDYVNVLLLRASSSSVLIRVGNGVVLYERSQIKKIERSTDQIKQR